MATRSSSALALALALALSVALSVPALASQPSSEPSGLPGEGAEGDAPERTGRATVLGQDDPDAIDGRYIVVFDPGASAEEVTQARSRANSQGAEVHHTYSAALRGFAATLPEQALRGLRNNPNISYIEADAIAEATTDQSPVTWNLDRIDQRDLPLDDVYTYNFTGDGIRAHIIDTGIRLSHDEFGGRAEHGFTAINDGNGSSDCNGHGTHVAGTVGGEEYGVAKEATLVSVRVLDCNGSGTTSGVIAGVDWVTNDAGAHSDPAVANMSLGGTASTALDDAVESSVAAGVTYAVAAGGGAADACAHSPARVDSALTVGASDQSDNAAPYTNQGGCLDLFAPGSDITSAWHSSDSATNTLSGTSMASPHVAGVAALYLEDNPSAGPATVGDVIVDSATQGRLSNVDPGTPNLLLYSLLKPSTDPCAGYDERYSGFLDEGQSDHQPGGGHYYAASGDHHACLVPPEDAEFDLNLWRWTGWTWSLVATGTASGSPVKLSYHGSAGYYMWEIHAADGSGAYDFAMTRP